MTTDTPPRQFGMASIIALGLAVAFLLGLGTWQLQRKQWKDALLAEIAARATQPPLTALSGTADPKAEYVPVRLRGRFLPETERHVFISVPKQPNGVGGPGYWVFQIFAPDGAQGPVYVNRGFVPEARKAEKRTPEGSVAIDGIVRLPEPRGRFSNSNDPAKNTYYVRSPNEFGGSARRDLYIDMTGPAPAAGLPLPLVGKITIPNRHMEYALTWYALAATLLGVAFAWGRR
jgi:surfeit locus 1 family protein